MLIRMYGKTYELNSETKVLVAKVSSGLSYFGEFAYFVKETKNHLVFKTESGAIVKTDKYLNTVGKARKNWYFVSLKVEGRENDKNFIRQHVRYWNDEKVCFETK